MRLIFGLAIVAFVLPMSLACFMPPVELETVIAAPVQADKAATVPFGTCASASSTACTSRISCEGAPATTSDTAASGAAFRTLPKLTTATIPMMMIDSTVDFMFQQRLIDHHNHAIESAHHERKLLKERVHIKMISLQVLLLDGHKFGDRKVQKALKDIIDYQETLALLKFRVRSSKVASKNAWHEMERAMATKEDLRRSILGRLSFSDTTNPTSQALDTLNAFTRKMHDANGLFADLPGEYFELDAKVKALSKGRDILQQELADSKVEAQANHVMLDKKLATFKTAKLADVALNSYKLLTEIGYHRAGVRFAKEKTSELERALQDLHDLSTLEAKMQAIMAPFEEKIQMFTHEAIAALAAVIPSLV